MKKGLTLLLFFYSFLLIGQELTQTVKGRVTDDQSSQPLIGATVSVANSDPIIGAITNIDGYFRLNNVPIGRKTIQVSYLGYEPAVFPGVLIGSGKEVVINVELKESLEQLEEVVVTADSNTGEPLNDMATVSAISISVEETSRYAATFDDPARAALTFAGVQTGGDDLLNEIVIRGNSPKGILWRLEGVEIQNPNHFAQIGSSAGGISMLSSNMLANSDFFTSAFPAQYGNATSGVFDLNLRKGNFDKNETAFEVGLLGVGAASEGPLSKNSNASYLVNYRYSTLALINNLGIDILGEQEEVAFQDLSFKFFIPTKKLGSFSIWGLGGDNTYEFIPDRELQETLYDQENQRMGVAGITNTFYVSDDAYLETIVSASYQNIGDLEDSLRARVTFEENFTETQLRLSTLYNHKLSSRSTIRGGLILSNLGYDLVNRFYDDSTQTYVFPINENDNAGFYQSYFNWQYRPSSRLTINSGLHYSTFSLNKKSYFEPRFGFKYDVARGTLTGGFGLHSRMETVALYTARQLQEDGSYVQNNRDLGFTRAWHGVIGFQKPIANNALRLKSEIYYQHLFDVPIWPDDTTSNAEALTFSVLNTFDGYTTFELANDGTGRNYGVEFTLEKPLKNGVYGLSTLSLYESKYKGSDGIERDTQFGGGFIFNVIGGKEFQVGKNGNNSIGVNVRYISAGGKRQAPIDLQSSTIEGFTIYDFNRNYELQLENYQRIDFGISYRRNKPNSASIFALNVQNVMARENELERFYVPGLGVVTESQLGFFPNLSYRLEF